MPLRSTLKLKAARAAMIEPLPDGFRGFWISAPGNMIHLISANED